MDKFFALNFYFWLVDLIERERVNNLAHIYLDTFLFWHPLVRLMSKIFSCWPCPVYERSGGLEEFEKAEIFHLDKSKLYKNFVQKVPLLSFSINFKENNLYLVKIILYIMTIIKDLVRMSSNQYGIIKEFNWRSFNLWMMKMLSLNFKCVHSPYFSSLKWASNQLFIMRECVHKFKPRQIAC